MASFWPPIIFPAQINISSPFFPFCNRFYWFFFLFKIIFIKCHYARGSLQKFIRRGFTWMDPAADTFSSIYQKNILFRVIGWVWVLDWKFSARRYTIGSILLYFYLQKKIISQRGSLCYLCSILSMVLIGAKPKGPKSYQEFI